MKVSRRPINLVMSVDLGFIAVVIVAYFSAISTAGYAPRGFTPIRLTVLIAAGLGYLVVGTFGFARCRHHASRDVTKKRDYWHITS